MENFSKLSIPSMYSLENELPQLSCHTDVPKGDSCRTFAYLDLSPIPNSRPNQPQPVASAIKAS